MKNAVPLLYLATSFLCLVITDADSQNLESIKLKNGVAVSGSLNLNALNYFHRGGIVRRDPFNFLLTGNLFIDLFGYGVPFSFSFGNAGKNFTQPFNQFALTPQYKWVKTYIGFSTMTLSKYTLAGHVFFGTGAELSPGKWRLAAMYGRLRKSVNPNLLDSLDHAASYKRTGYGFKLGYETNNTMISTTAFTARDDVHSLLFASLSTVSPQHNVAVSLSFRKKVLRRLTIEGEYGVSALTFDTRANPYIADSAIARRKLILNRLITPNATTRSFDAFNSSVSYVATAWALAFKFEQVSPEYQTLGAYYFNNDFRNLTIAPTIHALKNKLHLSANVGIQENNLDNTRQSTSTRLVSSFHISFIPTEKLSATLNYSNFRSYTNVRPQRDPYFRNNLDSLNFFQVNQSTNGSLIRNFGSADKKKTVMLSVAYQQAVENGNLPGSGNLAETITANMSNNFSLKSRNLTMVIAANYFASKSADLKSVYWGPTLSVVKSYLEKTVQGVLTAAYNQTLTNNIKGNPVFNGRSTIRYTPKAKQGKSNSPHQASVVVNVLSKIGKQREGSSTLEVTSTVSYTCSF